MTVTVKVTIACSTVNSKQKVKLFEALINTYQVTDKTKEECDRAEMLHPRTSCCFLNDKAAHWYWETVCS